MRNLLLTTAILGALAAPALAQDQTLFREAPEATDVRGSEFLGMRVYASEAAVEGEEFEGVQEAWEDIGEVADVVLNRDGAVQAVLVDIGGFLGIGERTVAVSMDALQFVSDSATAEEADDFFLVINASRDQLENAPEYGGAEQSEDVTAEEAASETEAAIEEGGDEAAAAGAAAGAAVEGTDDAATTVVTTTEDAAEEVEVTAENAAEGVENVVEETGEEVADAGAEVADEAADAGEEVAEEVDQADLSDTQEDQAEVVDESADAQEETAEESAQATDEAADESADQAEAAAEAEAEAAEERAEATEEVDAAPAGAAEDDVLGDVAVGEAADLAATGAAEGDPADEIAEETTAETVDEAEETTEAATAEEVARTPIEREGFAAAGTEDLTADRLEGAAVFDVNDERVGEVGEILLSEEGQVQQLVIDVGGFLGLGEKPVALDMATLDILRQDEGEDIRVYVSQTKEELEAMERYEAE